MIHKVNVLVVEDEFIVGEDIRRNLLKQGYEVDEVVRNGLEAIEKVKAKVPDIILLDINLGDGFNGIETAEEIRKIAGIPIIYVTAHSDTHTFEKAKQTAPDAFIIKPFNFNNLHSAIELAIYNYSRRENGQSRELINEESPIDQKPEHYLFNNTIFVKIGKGFEKVKLIDICYVKADGSYSILYTHKKHYTLAMNLQKVHDRLNRKEFIRSHRSYVVNINRIERIDGNNLKVGDILIPLSKALRDDFLKMVNSL